MHGREVWMYRQTDMRMDACNKRIVGQTIGQRSRDRRTDMCTDGHKEQKTEGLIDIWKDRRTDEQIDRHTDMEISWQNA